MVAGGLYRHGAFFPAEAFGFAVVSLALIVVSVAVRT